MSSSSDAFAGGVTGFRVARFLLAAAGCVDRVTVLRIAREPVRCRMKESPVEVPLLFPPERSAAERASQFTNGIGLSGGASM
jgi:hypothetical protein